MSSQNTLLLKEDENDGSFLLLETGEILESETPITTFVPENKRDLNMDLQYVIEGDVVNDSSLFGTFPDSPPDPTLRFLGKNQRWSYQDIPESFPIQTLDEENRSNVVLQRNTGILDFSFELTDVSDTGILNWFFGDHGNDLNSKSFVFSRLLDGVEYYRILSGCIPLNATLSLSNNQTPIRLFGQILVTNSGPEITANPIPVIYSLATEITDYPIYSYDGGTASFLYDSVDFKEIGLSITVQTSYSLTELSESLNIVHALPTKRSIHGIITILKPQGTDNLQTDVFGATPRDMSRILLEKKNGNSGYSLDLSKIILNTDGVQYQNISSSSVAKQYTFDASDIKITEIL